MEKSHITHKIINVKEKEILIDNRLEERNPGSLSGQSLDVTNRKLKNQLSRGIVLFLML